jgi:putative MATE family efflux protein
MRVVSGGAAAIRPAPVAEGQADDTKARARQAMLHGPILPTMLRLALPTVSVLVVQTLVTVAETFYVGFLGTAALAGVSLVFPIAMLMTMMSGGGVGGGVASAVARQIGAGRREDADALLWHAVVIALGFGGVFMTAALVFGPTLYHALGGRGPTLEAALVYSAFLFAGSIGIWLVNLTSAALRGAGDVKVPAFVTAAGAAVVIALSPALIFGFGPIPRLGIAGAGIAVTFYYAAASLALIAYLATGRGTLTLRISPLRRRLFREILRVGLLSAAGTLQSNLTVVLITGAVARFGTAALAGYGIASRLDYVLIPLLFGVGTAAVTMVGTNVGAGAPARARRVAWTGALAGTLMTGVIGTTAALAPTVWVGSFTHDPAVLATGAMYLRIVAPFYAFIGLGMLLYFASQGAGRVMWPFLAGTARLTITAGLGCWLVARAGIGLPTLFAVVCAGSVAFGAITAASVALSKTWGDATG